MKGALLSTAVFVTLTLLATATAGGRESGKPIRSDKRVCDGWAAVALAHTEAAMLLLERGEEEAALTRLAAADELIGRLANPARRAFERDWLLLVGHGLRFAGMLATSISYYRRCADQFPRDAQAQLDAGGALESAGIMCFGGRGGRDWGPVCRKALAYTIYSIPDNPPRIRRIPTGSGPIDVSLAAQRLRSDVLQAAARYLRAAGSLQPEWITPRLRLARVLAAQGRSKDAERELRIVLGRATDDNSRFLAQLFLGQVLEANGRLDEATDAYRRARDLDFAAQSARVALSVALHRQGRLAASKEEAEESLLAPRPHQDPFLVHQLCGLEEYRAQLAALRRRVAP
jgi:tetratricopeptide (TPR) repeat protein